MQVNTCGSLPELSEPELDAELDEAALGDLLGVRARADGLFEEAEGSWVSGLTGPFTWASPPPNAKFIPVGLVPVSPLAFTTLKAVTCMRKADGSCKEYGLLLVSFAWPPGSKYHCCAVLCQRKNHTTAQVEEGAAACSLCWSHFCLKEFSRHLDRQ